MKIWSNDFNILFAQYYVGFGMYSISISLVFSRSEPVDHLLKEFRRPGKVINFATSKMVK